MCKIPVEYIAPILEIWKWCTENYSYDAVEEKQMDQLFHKVYHGEYEESDLYLLDQCISSAKSYPEECGVDKGTVQKIYNWCRPLYEQSLKK